MVARDNQLHPTITERQEHMHVLHAAPQDLLLEQKYFHAGNLILRMAKFARLSVVTI